MSSKNANKLESIRRSTSIKIVKSKFGNDNSFNYPPRKRSVQINILKNKKNYLLFPQIKLGDVSPSTPCNLHTSFNFKYLKNIAEKRKSSISIMKHYTNNSPKNKNLLSIRRIEENIKQKIFDLSMQIDQENNSDNENNTSLRMSLDISTNSKKMLDDSKLNKSRRNVSINENTNSFINRKNSIEKTLSVKNSTLKYSSSISKHSKNQKKNEIKNKDVFRFIEKKKLVYDSIEDDDDYLAYCNGGYVIPINSKFLFVFDFLLIFCNLFDVVYTPYNLSNIKCFCDDFPNGIKYIYYIIDVVYILDLLISCFRSYYNFEFKIMTKNEDVIFHYLFGQFFFDFCQAIPFFSYIIFKCNKINQKCYENDESLSQSILLLCRYLKQLKFLKILDSSKNSITFNFQYKIIDKHRRTSEVYYVSKWVLICVLGIYNFVSMHIFIGHQSYPNWIVHLRSQNKKMSSLYLSSFYFLMTTMTTVGYGDIVCISTIETFYQIILLTLGVSVYSWIVSNIGNYVKNQNHAAVKLNQDENILEEIRISHPKMPFKLYNNILQHLKSRKLRQQKCDANILINSLPYSLRNHILFTMHAQTVKKLKIFKNCQNTDFILKLLANFIPLFSKKNAILIYEDQLVENIVFIKEGRCSLEACIDLESPEDSIYKYFTVKFRDIIDTGNNASNYESSFAAASIPPQHNVNYLQSELENVLDNNKSFVSSAIDESKFEKEIGKCDFGGNFEESNYQFIHIINILKNENYGSVYMLLGKPSPLSLRLKSKKGELFLLRKFDVFALCKKYPNIMKRQYKKDYLNMIEIKNKTLGVIKRYCESNGIKLSKIKPVKHSTITNEISYNIKEEKNNTNNISNINNVNNNNNNNIKNINIENNQNQKKLTEEINKSKHNEAVFCDSINNNINTNINNNLIINESNKKLKVSSNSVTVFNSPKKNNENSNNYVSFAGDGIKKKTIENSIYSSAFVFNNFLKKDNNKNDNFIKNITTFKSMDPNKKKFGSDIISFKTSILGESNINPSKKNVRTIRMAYVKKLKKKLNEYKKAKKYYKNLYLKRINKFKSTESPFEDKSNKISSTTNILGDISSSSSQSSNLSSISQKIKIFNNNEINIISNIRFSIKAKYKSLNNFTVGEYAKNKNLRECVKNFIANYITFEKLQKSKDKNDGVKKYSHSVSPKKSSSLSSFEYINISPNVSSNVFQNNFNEFAKKNQNQKNNNYITFINSNMNFNNNINNNINNNYKYFINYSPQVEITKYNQNLNFLSVSPMKSSKNEIDNKLNLSSIRFLNPNKRKFTDYEVEQILDENKYPNFNKNLKKCMTNNLRNYNKNLMTLKSNENNDNQNHLTYGKGRIFSGSNTYNKNDKKSNSELLNNLFISKDDDNKNTRNICSII